MSIAQYVLSSFMQAATTACAAPLSTDGGTMTQGNGRVPLHTSADLARTYSAEAHEIADAITATVINAQAGLHLLSAQAPDLEEVRQVLNGIANDGKRAGEIVVRLRSLMKKVPTSDGVLPDYQLTGALRWPK